MQLTQQRHSHFQTFGFLIFRQLLSPEGLAQYSHEFNAGLDAWIESGRHDRKARHYASLMEKTSPFIASLADDSRFVDVAEQLLGKDVLCIAVDGNTWWATHNGTPTHGHWTMPPSSSVSILIDCTGAMTCCGRFQAHIKSHSTVRLAANRSRRTTSDRMNCRLRRLTP